jgi:hypothetical protein
LFEMQPNCTAHSACVAGARKAQGAKGEGQQEAAAAVTRHARLQRSRFTSAWRQDNKTGVLCAGSARCCNMLHDVQQVHVKAPGECAQGGRWRIAAGKRRRWPRQGKCGWREGDSQQMDAHAQALSANVRLVVIGGARC